MIDLMQLSALAVRYCCCSVCVHGLLLPDSIEDLRGLMKHSLEYAFFPAAVLFNAQLVEGMHIGWIVLYIVQDHQNMRRLFQLPAVLQ